MRTWVLSVAIFLSFILTAGMASADALPEPPEEKKKTADKSDKNCAVSSMAPRGNSLPQALLGGGLVLLLACRRRSRQPQ